MKLYNKTKLRLHDNGYWETVGEKDYIRFWPVGGGDGGKPASEKGYSPAQLASLMGTELGAVIPDWVNAIAPDLAKFYKKALTDRDFPLPIKQKNLAKAIQVMAKTAFNIVLKNVNEPADLFMIDVDGLIEKSWQGLINWATSYSPTIAGVTRPERAAFRGYEADLRGRFTELAEGKGFAIEKMEADFRESMRGFDEQTRQKVQAFNRLSASNPRLRKSMLVDLQIARGGWEQSARDVNLSRQAEQRAKSEFYGTTGLLELAQTAIGEEATANRMNLAADQLQIERDRIFEQLTLQGKGLAGSFLGGATAFEAEKNRVTAMNEALRTERLGQLTGLLGYGTDLFKYGRNYALGAATGAGGLLGTGLGYASDIYRSDIYKYAGASQTRGAQSPLYDIISGWMNVGGQGLGALGSLLSLFGGSPGAGGATAGFGGGATGYTSF